MAMDRRERGVETRKRSREKTSAGPSNSITYDFLRFLFGPKTTLFDNLTPSLHFHPTFPFPSLLHSHRFSRVSIPYPSPLSQRRETSLRVHLPLCRIYVFWRESSLLDWAAVGYDPIHRFFFATHSRIYTCCSTNGA